MKPAQYLQHAPSTCPPHAHVQSRSRRSTVRGPPPLHPYPPLHPKSTTPAADFGLSTTAGDDGSSSTLSAGAIAGIAIAGTLLLAGTVAVAAVIAARRHKAPQSMLDAAEHGEVLGPDDASSARKTAGGKSAPAAREPVRFSPPAERPWAGRDTPSSCLGGGGVDAGRLVAGPPADTMKDSVDSGVKGGGLLQALRGCYDAVNSGRASPGRGRC
jgi:hypothetical protein